MTLTVTDTTKPKLTLIEYSKEIGPMIRDVLKKKEILKEYKDENEKVAEFTAHIKEIQDELKKYVNEHPDYKELLEEIKALENEIKQAIKGAERSTDGKYKAADLKGFFTARAKESVEKTVTKGKTFKELEDELK